MRGAGEPVPGTCNMFAAEIGSAVAVLVGVAPAGTGGCSAAGKPRTIRLVNTKRSRPSRARSEIMLGLKNRGSCIGGDGIYSGACSGGLINCCVKVFYYSILMLAGAARTRYIHMLLQRNFYYYALCSLASSNSTRPESGCTVTAWRCIKARVLLMTSSRSWSFIIT